MLQLARTSFVCFGLLAGSAGVASAWRTTLIHDTTTAVEVELSATTVLCSAADYSGAFLKVGMPQLAALTLLDHQNIGANAPCVAAGFCSPSNSPADIIDPAEPTEVVNIRVRATRQDLVDEAAGTCTTTLIENVNVVIRGKEFTHEREQELGSRKIEDCAPAPVTGSGSGSADGKADTFEEETVTESAGCSAAGGSTGGSLVMLLGALFTFRRRAKRS
jgi:hypothetical protein